MALVDVSVVLADPEFTDPITITRVTQTVNSAGLVQSTSATFSAVAVVYPAEGRILDLLSDAERGLNSLVVVTTFGLIERSATQTDEITWAGKQWRVSKLNDWRNFGAGFVEAVCLQKSPTE